MDERAVVDRFWELMRSNDFAAVGVVLSDAFVLEWPGTRERFRGRERFAAVNTEYPAHGRWTFDVQRTVVGDGEAVTDTVIGDGVVVARAVSFFTIEDGLITRLVEHWPEPTDPPHDRSHLAEPLD
jgi:ketosteroid isomerase-like protein